MSYETNTQYTSQLKQMRAELLRRNQQHIKATKDSERTIHDLEQKKLRRATYLILLAGLIGAILVAIIEHIKDTNG